jgi:hypothetical protein
LKTETSEDEFHCQKLCSLIPECKIFHWNRSNQLCNLFSTLQNGNASIVEESDSVIGQPDCFNMDSLWPESLISINSVEEKRGVDYNKLLR